MSKVISYLQKFKTFLMESPLFITTVHRICFPILCLLTQISHSWNFQSYALRKKSFSHVCVWCECAVHTYVDACIWMGTHNIWSFDTESLAKPRAHQLNLIINPVSPRDSLSLPPALGFQAWTTCLAIFTWLLGIQSKLRSSCLHGNHFPHTVISPFLGRILLKAFNIRSHVPLS